MVNRFVTAFLLALAACTPLHPDVSLARGVSLGKYRVIVVGRVSDATGYPFNYPIADSVRERLAHDLIADGLTVVRTPADSAGPVLLVESTLQGFKSGALSTQLPTGMGTSRCTLSSELRDYRTGRHLGDITASEVSSEDTQQMSPFALMMTCARMVAEALHKQMKT